MSLASALLFGAGPSRPHAAGQPDLPISEISKNMIVGMLGDCYIQYDFVATAEFAGSPEAATYFRPGDKHITRGRSQVCGLLYRYDVTTHIEHLKNGTMKVIDMHETEAFNGQYHQSLSDEDGTLRISKREPKDAHQGEAAVSGAASHWWLPWRFLYADRLGPHGKVFCPWSYRGDDLAAAVRAFQGRARVIADSAGNGQGEVLVEAPLGNLEYMAAKPFERASISVWFSKEDNFTPRRWVLAHNGGIPLVEFHVVSSKWVHWDKVQPPVWCPLAMTMRYNMIGSGMDDPAMIGTDRIEISNVTISTKPEDDPFTIDPASANWVYDVDEDVGMAVPR